jgi:hypothetical protein
VLKVSLPQPALVVSDEGVIRLRGVCELEFTGPSPNRAAGGVWCSARR